MNNLRYSLRTLARTPGFTVSAVLALALGIGANAAVFSVVYAVLLNPLPYADPGRLVRIYEANPAQGIERGDVSPGTFVDVRARNRSLEHVAVFMARRWLLSFGDEPELLSGALVSPSVFPMLGVAPVVGRTFRPESVQPPPYGDDAEVVISHSLWQRRFGGRPDVVGQTVKLEGRRALTVVGVMPAGFDFPGRAEFWRNAPFVRPIGNAERAVRYHESIARLAPGVSLDQARVELSGIARQLKAEHPSANAGYSLRIERLEEVTVGEVRPALLVLLGVVGCVLLIGCTNVANLLLARATARRRELAVRVALGAGRGQLLLQSLSDCAVLAVFGGAGGVLLGYWGMRVLTTLGPQDTPRLQEVAFGGPVYVLVVVLGVTAACLIGIVPILTAAPASMAAALKHGGRGEDGGAGRSARSWLIGAEVALTLVLLVGASLLLRSFIALRHVDLGFQAERVLTADLILSTARFGDASRPWFRLVQHFDQVLSELAALPGVEAAGGITGVPLTGEVPSGKFWMGDGSAERPDATRQFDVGISIITPGYFEAMRIPVSRGRSFTAADRFSEAALTAPAEQRADKPRGAVIVSESMARRYWPGGHAVGQSIVLADHWAASSSIIVGVAADVRSAGVDQPATPTVYVPMGEVSGFRLSVALRGREAVESLASLLRARLHAFDAQMLVSNVRTLDDVVSGAVSRPRFNLVLLAGFALLALALAAVGISGVIAYLVTRRTREIGIRMALGARRGDVLKLVLGEGLRPVVGGVVVGAAVAVAAARLMRTLVFGIAPIDPASFALAGASLVVVALAAAWIPARRAAAVDPLVALRDE
jgi:putative ABC transport system permease protein